MATDLSNQVSGIKDEYKYGFRDSDANYSFKSKKGLTREVVEEISAMKDEPRWMRELRLKALDVFWAKPTPTWGGMISEGRNSLEQDPLICLWPSLALFFTVLALNFAGDRLRSFFEVREGGL